MNSVRVMEGVVVVLLMVVQNLLEQKTNFALDMEVVNVVLFMVVQNLLVPEASVRHGGGKRCSHDFCTKSAQGKTEFCITHGRINEITV